MDGKSSRLLKLTAPGVARSLTQLFNYSLKTGEIPSEWKSANITPVLKKGRKEDVNNYRPISVLPIVAKVFERIVHKQLYEYLERNQILHPDQSGYRPKHSTLDALLKATDNWRWALDSNELVGAVFIDLSMAFDSIDHELLLSKLESYGIREDSLHWFKNYLTGRRQRVLVNGIVSTWRPMEKGVPQGSILGPLLFGVFVNDLPVNINQCSVSLYADDTALYHSSRNSTELKDSLESALDGVASWVNNNGLKMNVRKTQAMFLGRRGRRNEVEHASLTHQGVTLTTEPKVKFLGVIVDKDLNWNDHVTKIRRKCLASLAQLRQLFPAVPRRTRILLYNALVLPHLDYCSCIWGTCGTNLQMKLERIQTMLCG